jgi:hypothetical protein
MSWKVVAAAARGAGHALKDEPCQDAYHWLASESWLVAVVCDGAGSAAKSDVGAAIASRTIVNYLMAKTATADDTGVVDANHWQPFVIDAIAQARQNLCTESGVEDLAPYHATVVGVIANQTNGLFFHIGDGTGTAVYENDWLNCVISKPENGEYADQTFFFTMDNWREHLRLLEFNGHPDMISLMSDGAMSFVMARELKGMDSRFIEPVHRYLSSVETTQGQRALAATLDNPKTYSITSDDKTLLWAKRDG